MPEAGLGRALRPPAGPLPAASLTKRGEPAGAVVLETPRLRLRPFTAGDHAALHAITARPESFAYSERGPMSGEESWARLLRHIGHWAALGFGMFAVEEKATGELVGEVGFGDFRRGLGVLTDCVPEAAWTIAPHKWHRGYAREAAAAAHDWIGGRTACIVHRDNRRSLEVAAGIGYRPIAETLFRGYPAVLLHRLAPAAGC